jgi:hypothetical protein
MQNFNVPETRLQILYSNVASMGFPNFADLTRWQICCLPFKLTFFEFAKNRVIVWID